MRLQSVLLFTLLGFLATAGLSNDQNVGVRSDEPVITTGQNPAPPPPECGLYDICKEKAKA